MCGICGIVNFSGKRIDRDIVLNMREKLAHRGPDDAGFYSDKYIGLGHRRLSIIDLSDKGRQPLSNENKNIWVVSNGEIYNYVELRNELLAAGHRFSSCSDAEVLVHAYEEWGIEKLLKCLSGMYAFAIWDTHLKTMWLVRDRLGVKPLFYMQKNGMLFFASELHVLYEFTDITPETIDHEALDYFFAFGYVPPDHCLIKGIKKLQPGHALRHTQNDTRCWRYWNVDFRPSHKLSLPTVLEDLSNLLQVSVHQRLRSDVPLGCFLSGGIDSGLVTALAARIITEPLHTFTVGFQGSNPSENELALAQLVASRYGTRHMELIVKPQSKNLLPRILWHCGEPFADVSILPTCQICSEARRSIKVALTGDGGDESFCGYYNVYSAHLGSIMKQIFPDIFRHELQILTNALSKLSNVLVIARRLNTLLNYANKPVSFHYNLADWWYAELRSKLYDQKWLNRIDSNAMHIITDIIKNINELQEAEKHLYIDLQLRLPGDYLTKIDVASNLVALEVRSPFLDHKLVEYTAKIPVSIKLLNLRQKGLLRTLAQRYLPIEVVKGRKTGFSPPMGRWLRDEWAPLIRELVGESLANRPGIFNRTIIHHIIDEHLSGKKNHAHRLWALVCFEVWWRLFIDHSLKPGDEL